MYVDEQVDGKFRRRVVPVIQERMRAFASGDAVVVQRGDPDTFIGLILGEASRAVIPPFQARLLAAELLAAAELAEDKRRDRQVNVGDTE